MSYVSLFKQLAAAAEDTVGKLAGEVRSRAEAAEQLAEAEEAWRAAIEDGVIDERETAKLRGLFEKLGMVDALSQLGSGELDQVSRDVLATLRDARREAGRGSDLRLIDLNLALQQARTHHVAASDTLRREGQMYDNLVANLRA